MISREDSIYSMQLINNLYTGLAQGYNELKERNKALEDSLKLQKDLLESVRAQLEAKEREADALKTKIKELGGDGPKTQPVERKAACPISPPPKVSFRSTPISLQPSCAISGSAQPRAVAPRQALNAAVNMPAPKKTRSRSSISCRRPGGPSSSRLADPGGDIYAYSQAQFNSISKM